MLIYGTVDFGQLLERSCVGVRDSVGVAILCTLGQLSFAECQKSGTSLFCILLASLCNIPCSLETISDFLQTRKFIRKIRKILYLKSAFQIIW